MPWGLFSQFVIHAVTWTLARRGPGRHRDSQPVWVCALCVMPSGDILRYDSRTFTPPENAESCSSIVVGCVPSGFVT
jgi:hypothetical protein